MFREPGVWERYQRYIVGTLALVLLQTALTAGLLVQRRRRQRVEDALRAKSRWIVSKLGQARERHERIEAARIEWKDGASFPFLGEPVIVVLDPRQAVSGAGAMLNTAAQALPGVARHTLHVGLPQSAGAAQIRDAVQAWLMRQAKRLFTERLDHYAPRLGVQPITIVAIGTLVGGLGQLAIQ